MNLRKQVLGGLESAALRSALMRGAATVASLGALVAVTRSLGAEDAGLFLLAHGLIAIAATLGLGGMTNLLTRRVATLRASGLTGAQAYRAGRRRGLCGAGLAAAALIASAPWLATSVFGKPALAGPLALMAPAVIPMALVLVAGETLRGLAWPLRAQLMQVVAIPLLAALLVPAAAAVAGVRGAGVAYGLSACVAAALATVLLARALPPTARPEPALPADEAPHATRSMWLLAGLGILSLRAAPLLLGMLASSRAVTEFEISLRVLSLSTLVLVAINTVLAPRFAELCHRGQYAELERLARQAARFSCLLLIPFLALVCTARPLVLGLFGLGAEGLGPVFLVLAAGELINIVTGPATLLLLMSGGERTVRNLSAAGLVMVVVGCLLLVPSLGILGAALASAGATALVNLGAALAVRRVHGLWTLPLPGLGGVLHVAR